MNGDFQCVFIVAIIGEKACSEKELQIYQEVNRKVKNHIAAEQHVKPMICSVQKHIVILYCSMDIKVFKGKIGSKNSQVLHGKTLL